MVSFVGLEVVEFEADKLPHCNCDAPDGFRLLMRVRQDRLVPWTQPMSKRDFMVKSLVQLRVKL